MIYINKANYDAEITNSEKPVLLVFSAPWCVPCKAVAKIMEELEKEQTKVKMAKVNIEESPELAVKHGVANIPVTVFLKNGKPMDRKAGLQSKAAILGMISK